MAGHCLKSLVADAKVPVNGQSSNSQLVMKKLVQTSNILLPASWWLQPLWHI